MSNEVAISVQNVSKAYRIWENPAARLVSPLQDAIGNVTGIAAFKRRAARSYRDFWALKDISFEVGKGEAVGIIGRNGSGKSTLLQIIAGTLQPSSGSAKVNGRVAALLELGAGFNPEFTGRENVFLNGAVLGLSRQMLERKFDEIAVFSDIGGFIDQPVKTYSSGMAIRLAFAVAVAVEPDVLIVDEALSVGDVFFQQKCFKRVREMLDRGVSLLFVSHDIAAVQTFCSRSLFLSQGKSVYYGDSKEAATRYYSSATPLRAVDTATLPMGTTAGELADLHRRAAEIKRANVLPLARSRHGSRKLELIAASISDGRGAATLQAKIGETLRYSLLVRAHQDVAEPQTGINLYDRFNNLVFAAGNYNLGFNCGAAQKDSEFILEFNLTFDVQPGAYTVSLIVSEEAQDGPNSGMFYDVHEGVGPVTVYFSEHELMPFYGIAKLPMHILSCDHLRTPSA